MCGVYTGIDHRTFAKLQIASIVSPISVCRFRCMPHTTNIYDIVIYL